jgi:glutaredoxin
MARNTLIALVLAALVAAPAEAGKMYRWVDEYGNVSYQDRPPPEGQGRVEEKNLGDNRAAAGNAAAPDAAARFPVTLYMVPKCDTCDLARAYLKKRGVPFSEIDVSGKNPEAQQEMRKKVGELSVPTITVGSKIMKGYIESLVEGELNEAGYPKPEAPDKTAAPDAAPAP